jgi:hypothetical protein
VKAATSTLSAMQATVSTVPVTGGVLRKVAPIACGCALAGAAALVAAFDPAAPGSHFPACQFKAMTGLWCPGCGLTRGFHQLFTGHPLAALQHNLFVPLVMVAVVAGWWSWTRSVWGGGALRLPAWALRPLAVGLPVAVVAYGVLRNLPVAPFRSLAP